MLKILAEQLLTDDELWVFKQTLQHFRVTRSVPSLCTSLRPLITSTERLMLLVELAQRLPSEPLRRDFQKLCTLHFPKYHTFLRYFTPQPVTDGSKVIAQDASGQYLVTNKIFEKNGSAAAGYAPQVRAWGVLLWGGVGGWGSRTWVWVWFLCGSVWGRGGGGGGE